MTAIAAVLALTSTSALAQTAAPVATDPAPIATAPDAATPMTAEPAPAAPVASDPLAPTTAPTAPIAPDISATTAETTPASPRAKTAKRPVATTKAEPSVAVPKKVAMTETKPAPIESVKAASQVEPTPLVVTTPQPAAPGTTTKTTETLKPEVLPIAGAAGVGLLALMGVGVAVRRRKNDEEEHAIVEEQLTLETSREQIVAPRMMSEPAFIPVIDPVSTPVVEDDEFHDEFDLSKYGPHVQAAYRGPSEDNPSLSLKKRLKRGAALDQMARRTGATAAAVSTKSMVENRNFMLRPSTAGVSFRPAFQS